MKPTTKQVEREASRLFEIACPLPVEDSGKGPNWEQLARHVLRRIAAAERRMDKRQYGANFLWPAKSELESAGYEFANAKTEGYQKLMWKALLKLTAKKGKR